MERLLADREYLAGPYSYADIAFYMAQLFGDRMGAAMTAATPRLLQWRDRMTARPAVAQVAGAMAAYLVAQGRPLPAFLPPWCQSAGRRLIERLSTAIISRQCVPLPPTCARSPLLSGTAAEMLPRRGESPILGGKDAGCHCFTAFRMAEQGGYGPDLRNRLHDASRHIELDDRVAEAFQDVAHRPIAEPAGKDEIGVQVNDRLGLSRVVAEALRRIGEQGEGRVGCIGGQGGDLPRVRQS